MPNVWDGHTTRAARVSAGTARQNTGPLESAGGAPRKNRGRNVWGSMRLRYTHGFSWRRMPMFSEMIQQIQWKYKNSPFSPPLATTRFMRTCCQKFVWYVPTARALLEDAPQTAVQPIEPPQHRLSTTVPSGSNQPIGEGECSSTAEIISMPVPYFPIFCIMFSVCNGVLLKKIKLVSDFHGRMDSLCSPDGKCWWPGTLVPGHLLPPPWPVFV